MAALGVACAATDEPAAQDERAITIRVITAPLSVSCRSAAIAHSAAVHCQVWPTGVGQRNLCLASLVPCAAATVLPLGPVAYHRLVFRQGLKSSLVKSANVMAILGMADVGAAMLTAVPRVTGVVAGVLAVALITAVMACARQPVVRPAAVPAR